MPRSSKPNSFTDVSDRAQSTLDYIISGKEELDIAEKADQMPVSQALKGDQVVRFASTREQTRVLFITSDPKALKDDSWLVEHLKSVHTKFAEVHVAVLSQGKKREFPTKRFENNIWVYNINLSSLWFLSQTLERFAESQLQFGDGFRPDVIVALDPFTAGLAAMSLSARYDRPMQVHVLTDFLSSGFVEASKANKKKVKIAHKVLKKAHSVRTNSSLLKDKLEKEFPKIDDLGILPRHFDTESILKTKRTNTLKQKYPQYVFIILTAGTLDHDNTLYRTLDAARSMLLSPRIGLVVVGEGPMRTALEERAEILGIKEQIVFETNQSLLGDYMLSADLFVCTDTTAVGDEYVIQAAAAGLPIVMAKTPLREDLFVDGESALLCEAEDITGLSQKMNSILNTNAFRIQFSTNARMVVKDRLHTDPDLYRNAYRDSIEVVFGKMDLPQSDDELETLAETVAESAPDKTPAEAPTKE